MLRWVYKLECGHAILADDALGPDSEHRCYCPACGISCLIDHAFEYRDEEAAL